MCLITSGRVTFERPHCACANCHCEILLYINLYTCMYVWTYYIRICACVWPYNLGGPAHTCMQWMVPRWVTLAHASGTQSQSLTVYDFVKDIREIKPLLTVAIIHWIRHGKILSSMIIFSVTFNYCTTMTLGN